MKHNGTGRQSRIIRYKSSVRPVLWCHADKLINKKTGNHIGAIEYADSFKIEHIALNGYEFCGSWAKAQQTVEGLNAYERKSYEFNMKLYEEMCRYENEKGIQFDFAVLAGYMRFFKGPFQRRFNNRAINVHPARLDIFDEAGFRKYRGEGQDVIPLTLNDGQERTRSSIILVDAETDGGAVLVSGPWTRYKGKRPVEKGSDDAEKHQDKQKEESDWPALRFALRAIANGEIGLHKSKFRFDGNPVVVYKGLEMPYEGVDMEEMSSSLWL
ncbi:MAG: formyltransferase family protein [Candidatus Aenigmarchaeota archaeon]|nr:formyltransferase family protein [Candidatus Aenigmarchaeota archaeon]